MSYPARLIGLFMDMDKMVGGDLNMGLRIPRRLQRSNPSMVQCSHQRAKDVGGNMQKVA